MGQASGGLDEKWANSQGAFRQALSCMNRAQATNESPACSLKLEIAAFEKIEGKFIFIFCLTQYIQNIILSTCDQ